MEQGLISFWSLKYSEKPKFCQLQTYDVYHADIKALNLVDIGIAFLILAIGTPISIVIFVTERQRLFKNSSKNLKGNEKAYLKNMNAKSDGISSSCNNNCNMNQQTLKVSKYRPFSKMNYWERKYSVRKLEDVM